MELKKQLIPIQSYEIKKIENYLINQEKKGYKLHHAGNMFAYFSKSNPKEVVYRLISTEEIDNIKSYNRIGYESICEFYGYQLLRNPDIHSKTIEENESTRKHRNRLFRNNILEMICLYFMLFILYWLFYRFVLLRQAIMESSLLAFTFILVIVLLLVNILAWMMSLTSNKGTKGYLASGVFTYSKLLIKISFLFMVIIGLTTSLKTQPMNTVENQNKLPFHTLLEVMEGEYDSYENGSIPPDLSKTTLYQTSTFFTPNNLFLNEKTEFISGNVNRDIMYKISYHQCRNETVAKILYNDLIGDFKKNNSYGYEILESNLPYDQCIYIKDNTFTGAKVMIIQNGSTVAKVYIKVELDSNFNYVDEVMDKAVKSLQI